jgi:hypothetical protein
MLTIKNCFEGVHHKVALFQFGWQAVSGAQISLLVEHHQCLGSASVGCVGEHAGSDFS